MSSSFLSRLSLRSFGIPAQWGLLVLTSAVFMGVLNAFHVPAAFLLGPMLAAILIALADGKPHLPLQFGICAQGIVGCLVASSFTPDILTVIRNDWPVFLTITLGMIFGCALIGWLLANRRILPGSTAIWGFFPGGAMVMTLMADRFGEDMRIVAVMQYTRVVLVATVATAVAHFCSASGNAHAAQWFPAVHVADLVSTLLIGILGANVARRLRLPGGPLVWPMILACVLQMNGWLHIELPLWLLAPTYAVLGWMVGLKFTRQVIRETARAMPAILTAILILIISCALLSLLLVHLMHVDPLTAYLATGPGGADAIAIISSSSGADVAFVMAFQTARLFAVVLLGPVVAQFAAKQLLKHRKNSS